MLQLNYKQFDIPFQYPFRTAHGLKTSQPTLVVSLGFRGVTGYGEATAITYYDVSVERMIAILEQYKVAIERYSLIDPERFWHFLHHLMPNENFLICALDMAAWDLFAKLRKKKIYELWNMPWHNNTPTDYTIGIDSIDNMLEKVKQNPSPVYKVKLGLSQDIEMIEAIRGITDSKIRIDANAGWTLEQARTIIPALKKLDVELIEQPLAKDNFEDMQLLFQESELPLIADESCVIEADVDKCCAVFHGINIKLTKCGGLTPALRMIENARSKNKLVMMGCMNENVIGSAAIAQFIPQLDFVDADGPLLHKLQIAEGLTYENGKMNLGEFAGLGIKMIL